MRSRQERDNTASLKGKLAAGERVAMMHMRYNSPLLVERLGELGLDAVLIDCEKTGATVDQIENLCRAGRAAGIPTIVRPWLNDPGLISRYLDLGADGIMAPSIDSAEDATRLVEAVRYARYRDYASKVIVAMIESPQGIADLDRMLAVEGIDVWFVGPNDLAQKMGHPGGGSGPVVRPVVDSVLRRIAQAGRVPGTVADHASLDDTLQTGCRFVLIRLDELLARGVEEYRPRL